MKKQRPTKRQVSVREINNFFAPVARACKKQSVPCVHTQTRKASHVNDGRPGAPRGPNALLNFAASNALSFTSWLFLGGRCSRRGAPQQVISSFFFLCAPHRAKVSASRGIRCVGASVRVEKAYADVRSIKGFCRSFRLANDLCKVSIREQ